ncbi:MAG TPA: adenylate/guanylate cyclase domain-containing protein, partial [Candidatus Limnocylindria bacterium]|nr:adenylate/guanylate cyclase domain-containing protein [Candidatus Limnocylindria bacterium]
AEILSDLNAESRRQIDKYRGRVATTTGDGIIGMFDGAERAIRCGREISQSATRLGLGLRVGVHTGEVELLSDDIRGVAVHILNRVTALAAPGEVIVSGTTHELVADSDLTFEDRGLQELKGVDGLRQVWALLPEPAAEG